MGAAAVRIRVNIRRKLIVCAATAALAATGPFAAAAAGPAGPGSAGARSPVPALPLGGPNFTGIYLSTWGTSHVTFGDAFKSWLDQSGATVTAQAPMTLDADGGGFTMPVSPGMADRLDAWARMVYPGTLTISLAARTREASMDAKRRILQFGPMYFRVVPDVSWSAAVSVNGAPVNRVSVNGASAAGEVELATADYSEVLAGGGTPSPSGFRPDRLPFHLSQDTVDLLTDVSGRTGPVAGSLFGTLTPSFDHVPTEGPNRPLG